MHGCFLLGERVLQHGDSRAKSRNVRGLLELVALLIQARMEQPRVGDDLGVIGEQLALGELPHHAINRSDDFIFLLDSGRRSSERDVVGLERILPDGQIVALQRVLDARHGIDQALVSEVSAGNGFVALFGDEPDSLEKPSFALTKENDLLEDFAIRGVRRALEVVVDATELADALLLRVDEAGEVFDVGFETADATVDVRTAGFSVLQLVGERGLFALQEVDVLRLGDGQLLLLNELLAETAFDGEKLIDSVRVVVECTG